MQGLIPPIHDNTRYANLITRFSGTDSEERYKHNLLHDSVRLEETAFDNDSIRYRHNARGFRTDEFDSRESSIALGCSFTQGIGLSEELSWPTLLSTKLNHYVWNLGVGGSSIDTCYRIIKYYIRQLNVSNVFLLGPPEDRFEYYRSDERYDGLDIFMPGSSKHISDAFFKGWVMSDYFRENNYSKNIDAISNVCSRYDVNFYYIYSLDHNSRSANDKARDLLHPGPTFQRRVADMFYEKSLTK